MLQTILRVHARVLARVSLRFFQAARDANGWTAFLDVVLMYAPREMQRVTNATIRKKLVARDLEGLGF